MSTKKNCPNCNAPLEESELYCPKCGEKPGIIQQQEIVDNLNGKFKAVIYQKMRSPLCVLLIVCGLTNILLSLSNILDWLRCIFLLIATIGYISAFFSSKNPEKMYKHLKLISIYDSYHSVILSIWYYIVSAITIIIAILMLCGSAFLGSIGLEMFSEGGFFGALIVGAIGGLAALIIHLIRSIFRKRKAYFMALADTLFSEKYVPINIPSTISCVWGIVIIVTGVASALSSILILEFINQMLSFIPNETLSYLLGSLTSGSYLLMLLPPITSGMYFILSGVLMSSINSEQAINKKIYLDECAKLDRIKQETSSVIHKYQQKLKAEFEAKKQKEDEAKAKQEKAQLNMQEQQQLMLQMMMHQMMQNNPGFNMPTENKKPEPSTECDDKNDNKIDNQQTEKEN